MPASRSFLSRSLTLLSLLTAATLTNADPQADQVAQSENDGLSSYPVADGTLASTARVEGNCLASYKSLATAAFSKKALLACRGTPQQQASALNGYWGEQQERNTYLVVLPATAKDVAVAVKAIGLAPKPLDWAFVSGGHSQVNASSANDVLIDLAWLNKTELLKHFKLEDGKKAAVVSYESGALWSQVYSTLAGSGFAAIGARMSYVGSGGFTTGGGIGFLAGAYGFAMDRVVQYDVVIPSGELVTATKKNGHKDLFWALQGGNGQFGIVTKFYVLAVPEPAKATFGVTLIQEKNMDKALGNIVNWFQNNADPFSVTYFFRNWAPVFGSTDESNYALQSMLVTVRFSDPSNPSQADYAETFKPLFQDIDTSYGQLIDIPYAAGSTIFDQFFLSYGLRRGFYGPQVPSLTYDLLKKSSDTFDAYIRDLKTRGEPNIRALWGMQYMHRELNGNLPKSDADTAWPHSRFGHQTLFSPGYTSAANDGIMRAATSALNKLAYERQSQTQITIPDYPNYISPKESAGMSKTFQGKLGWNGARIYGNNLARLQAIKQKYDPTCLFKTQSGPVFASTGCLAAGYASIF